MTNIGEWTGGLGDAPTCHCLCEAIHPGSVLCDLEAPRALVSMSTEGRSEAFGLHGRRDIIMCKPCGQATMVNHPRARDLVVLESREKAAP